MFGPKSSNIGLQRLLAMRKARIWRAFLIRRRKFSSATLFDSHKLPLRGYLAAIAVFCNEVKGKSALALSRDLGLSCKSAFVLQHKLREAMAEEMKGRVVGGEGKITEIDSAYFGGYIKPSNRVENRIDRRLSENQNGKRKAVVVIRERDGSTIPGVFPSETALATSLPFSLGHERDRQSQPAWCGARIQRGFRPSMKISRSRRETVWNLGAACAIIPGILRFRSLRSQFCCTKPLCCSDFS